MKQQLLILALFLSETWFAGALVVAQSNDNYVTQTIAGNGVIGAGGDGGSAIAAQLFLPSGVAVDAQGNIYIADSNNHKIRIVTADGRIDTFAGNGTAGAEGDGGPARIAQLNIPPWDCDRLYRRYLHR
jgi:NHL repeat